jgi:P27 family predicted phage terminase small subunit
VTVGRKPKPTALRLVGGNAGKRPLPKNEAVVALAEPTPPAFLCDDAKVEWGRVCSVLYSAGLMTELDRAALAAYCAAYGRWAQAERAINRMASKDEINAALMIKTSNGNAIQNPLVGIANKAKSDMVRYAAEFGMTPSARSRVTATENEKEDPGEKFFNRSR